MSFNMINKRAYRSTWCTRRFFFPFSLSFNQNCNPNGSSSPKPTNQFLHCIRQVGGHEEEAHPFGPISLLGNFQLSMEDQITIPTHHIDWNSSYAANVGLLPFRGSSPCLLIILQCFQIIVVYRFFSFVTCLSFSCCYCFQFQVIFTIYLSFWSLFQFRVYITNNFKL